jgi:uncharacterized protein
MRLYFSLPRVVALCAFFLAAAACGTTAPMKFYHLSALPGSGSGSSNLARSTAIGVGPVEVATYLDRQEIVTSRGANELGISEFHQWAEPLESNLSQVLVENLSILLSADPVSFFPFPGSTPVDYRVKVKVLRLEGKLGENVSLIARWSIFDAEGKETSPMRESSFSEPTQVPDHEALVAAESRAVAALSREIADAIRAVLQGQPKK